MVSSSGAGWTCYGTGGYVLLFHVWDPFEEFVCCHDERLDRTISCLIVVSNQGIRTAAIFLMEANQLEFKVANALK